MKKISILMLPCIALSLTLLLAACGGGGGGSPQPPTTTQPQTPPPPPPPPDDDDDMPPSHSEYDLSMAASETPPPSYDQQAHYGIENTGTDKLHWSRLASQDPDDPDNPASRYIRGGGVTVGIVDDGVNLASPYLDGRIVMGDEITVDGQVYTDPRPYIQNGNVQHGTRVAGIIGGILNKDRAVGVAPEAKLLPIKFIGSRTSLADAYTYITANGAFVVNNSWGIGHQLLHLKDEEGKICAPRVEDDMTETKIKDCWLYIPTIYGVETNNFFVRLLGGRASIAKKRQLDPDDPDGKTYIDTTQEDTTLKDVDTHYDALSNALSGRNDDLLLVFSNGNHYWNEETGGAVTCFKDDDSLDLDPGDCLDDDNDPENVEIGGRRFNGFNTDGLTMTVTELYQNGRIFTYDDTHLPFLNKNSIGALKKAVADFKSEFGNNWINVAAVDVSNRIARFSNGCGVAKENCLAAPGDDIPTIDTVTTTVFMTDPDTQVKTPVDTKTVTAKVDGTSFAAPHVSGAAALLKGAFPNLSAPQVLTILLQSADGRRRCAAVSKKISCAEEVYGHGILNVTAAFTPTSYMAVANPARLNAGGVDEGAFALADSRIELSPAFGAAAWQKESLAIGGLDNYGRVYYTQMDLSDGVFVVKPLWEDGEITGGGIHASYASPLLRAQQSAAFMAQDSLAGGQWQGQHDNMDYSLSYGARAQQRSIGWQQGGGRLSWNYLSGSDDVAVNDFSTDDNSWRLPFSAAAMHQFAGAFDFSDGGTVGLPQVGISYGRSEDDGISQLASYAKWGSDDSGSVRLEGGYIQEKDGILGASFAGGFALSPGETFYQRLSGRHQLFGVEWVADYVRARSFAAGDGGIVQSLKARSDAWTVGANRGRWSLQWSQPLAINAGSMALSYISGYTESGDYAVTDKRLDISSGNRLQRTTLLYMREATDDLTFAFSLDYLRNAPHRNYRKDAVIGAAALRYTF